MKYCHSESTVQLKVTDDISVNNKTIMCLTLLKYTL